MTAIQAVLPSLSPVMPELILAIGVHRTDLIYGAFRGERSVETWSMSAVALILLIVARFLGARVAVGRAKVTTFNGSFIIDNFSKVMKAADPARLGRH